MCGWIDGELGLQRTGGAQQTAGHVQPVPVHLVAIDENVAHAPVEPAPGQGGSLLVKRRWGEESKGRNDEKYKQDMVTTGMNVLLQQRWMYYNNRDECITKEMNIITTEMTITVEMTVLQQQWLYYNRDECITTEMNVLQQR